MDRTKFSLAAAVSALLAIPAGASASPSPAPTPLKAQSFAELLEPIPNATERLRIADAEEANRPARLIPAQWQDHHHHHHHHHSHYRQWWWGGAYHPYSYGWYQRHHHHHHHHDHYNNY